MTDDNFYKYGYEDWHKQDEKELIWYTGKIDSVCEILFTFDKKTVFNFWQDYPEKLTPEQIRIFKKENPVLAELKPTPR